MARRTRPAYTILPDFAGKPFQTAYSYEDREYVVLGPHGGPVAWYGAEQDAYCHAAAANLADAEALAIEARAEERDAAAQRAA